MSFASTRACSSGFKSEAGLGRPSSEDLRLGVTGFGFQGSNAHVILGGRSAGGAEPRVRAFQSVSQKSRCWFLPKTHPMVLRAAVDHTGAVQFEVRPERRDPTVLVHHAVEGRPYLAFSTIVHLLSGACAALSCPESAAASGMVISQIAEGLSGASYCLRALPRQGELVLQEADSTSQICCLQLQTGHTKRLTASGRVPAAPRSGMNLGLSTSQRRSRQTCHAVVRRCPSQGEYGTFVEAEGVLVAPQRSRRARAVAACEALSLAAPVVTSAHSCVSAAFSPRKPTADVLIWSNATQALNLKRLTLVDIGSNTSTSADL